ncbi:chromate efflux transporter [Thalassotalea castellviae]|uniref:Chromate efflux transporter n=1 Tax=Thalassotalea castellviae TaxID=3075612 RepID=A0ABU3A2L5_9GAMM|nr:chromate efflux transporter [Thalassotalea sp. W431]MDT0604420.1 chromate efflux transporter [Thalassotalea sp. W431]
MNTYFDIFKQFLLLGVISFGGPAAHIGYFHHKFVHKLQWISQEKYGQIVALSQFLPGPGSSQVGFALGYHKAGIVGAFLAFIAFTLPSVILMIALAQLSNQLTDNSYFYGITHGLKLLAVVVVTDAVVTMFRSFCRSKLTKSLAVFTAITLLVFSNLLMQLAVLVIAGVIGIKYLTHSALESHSVKSTFSWWPFVLFIALLILLSALASQSVHWQLAADFYQAGSMVFGGGHVVLPLLQNLLDGQLTTDTFLTGYAAAQAVPGPMFTLATFLGFHLSPDAPYTGAIIATFSIFLPGFLLMLTLLKHWQNLAQSPKLMGAMQGINAAVVGLLASALYFPVFTSSVLNALDMAVVVLGFYCLKQLKVPIVGLVIGFSLLGILLNLA